MQITHLIVILNKFAVLCSILMGYFGVFDGVFIGIFLRVWCSILMEYFCVFVAVLNGIF